MLESFFDTELGIPCDLQPAEGGGWRCFPQVGGERLYFLDDRCAQPALIATGPGPRAEVAIGIPAQGSCGDGHVAVFALGDAVTSPPGVTYQRDGGSCVPATLPPGPHLRRLGARIADERFVAATLRTAAVGSAFGTSLVADDGATWIRSPGTASAEPCNPTQTPDAGRRCLPFTWATREARGPFADAACTRPIAMLDRLDCRETLAADLDLGSPSALRPVLEAWEGAEVFELRGGSCLHTSLSGRAAVLVGEPLPGASWPAVAEVVVGTGAVTQRWVASVDGARVAPVAWDALRVDGAACVPYHVNGRVVCLPAGLGAASIFADATCSTPLATSADEIVLHLDATAPQRGGSFQVLAAIGRAAAPYAGPTWRLATDGACRTLSSAYQRFELEPYDPPGVLTRADL